MANAKEIKRKVVFNSKVYTLIFTKHGEERIAERGIGIDMVIDSIESYNESYLKEEKQVVEKEIDIGKIRTVFYIKKSHIILITSMILGK